MNKTRKYSQRSAVTLITFLVFVVIGFMILGYLYSMMRKGVSSQDATSKSIEMMIQARAIIENLKHDIEGSIMFLPPEQNDDSIKELIIMKEPTTSYDDEDVALKRFRLESNNPNSTAYPFMTYGDDTVHQLPVVKIKYTYNVEEKTIVRLKETGVLIYGDDSSMKGVVCKYEFRDIGEVQPQTKLLGSNVSRFDFSHITIDRAGRPKLIEELEPSDFYLEDFHSFQSFLTYAQTAMIYVHLITRFDEGLYGMAENPEDRTGSSKDRKAEEVDIVTKFISRKCAVDVVEREWFSSIDNDLKY